MGSECSTSCNTNRSNKEMQMLPAQSIDSSPNFDSKSPHNFSSNFPLEPHPLVGNSLPSIRKAQILDSVRKNNIERVERYLLEGVKPTENLLKHGANYTLLHAAAESNAFQSLDILLLWLRRNMNECYEEIINIKDYNYHSPAMVCAINDAAETLHLFLFNGHIDINLKDRSNKSLEELCHENSYKCLSIYYFHLDPIKLKEIGPVPNLRTKSNPSGSSANLSLRKKSFILGLKIPESVASEIIRNVNNRKIAKDLNEFYKVHKLRPKSKTQQIKVALGGLVLRSNDPDQNNFIDKDFPHVLTSICKNVTHKGYGEFKKVIWKRPHEIFGCQWNEIHVFDGIEPSDIEQGKLSESHLLSCLVAISEFPSRLQRIFINHQISLEGKYKLRFYKQGIPTDFMVDDYFPCLKDQDTIVPIFSKPKGKELWVMLAEKAWAKLYGSYIESEENSLDEILEYLTGTPAQSFKCDETSEDVLWEALCTADKYNWLICGATKTIDQVKSLLPRQSYSVISTYEIGKYRVLKLRNPWEKLEWEGDFSDNSDLWTDEIKKKIGYSTMEDGMFCMTITDFRKHFKALGIGIYNEGWSYSYVEAKVEPRHAEYFSFKIEEKCDAYLRVHLEDRKLLKKFGQISDTYPMVNFEVAKIEKDGSPAFVVGYENRQVFSDTMRFRTIFACKNLKLSLTPGQYFLRVKIMSDPDHEVVEKIVVSSYSSGKSLLSHEERMKNFLKQIYLKEGGKGQVKDRGNNCLLKHGIYSQRAYFFVENNGKEKTWILTLTFNKITNIKLNKTHRRGPNTMKFVVPPGKVDVGWLKGIDFTKSLIFDWKVEEEEWI